MRLRPAFALAFSVAVAVGATGCSLAGLGGATLRLNSTNVEARTLVISVSAADAQTRILEVGGSDEVELGSGSVRIERYVLHRVVFGRDLASGLFLCASPCNEPLESFLVAYSPERLFDPSGELQLAFRVVSAEGMEAELSRTIGPEMLEDLWRTPTLEIRGGS